MTIEAYVAMMRAAGYEPSRYDCAKWDKASRMGKWQMLQELMKLTRPTPCTCTCDCEKCNA